jgi:hypothetical protein
VKGKEKRSQVTQFELVSKVRMRALYFTRRKDILLVISFRLTQGPEGGEIKQRRKQELN